MANKMELLLEFLLVELRGLWKAMCSVNTMVPGIMLAAKRPKALVMETETSMDVHSVVSMEVPTAPR